MSASSQQTSSWALWSHRNISVKQRQLEPGSDVNLLESNIITRTANIYLRYNLQSPSSVSCDPIYLTQQLLGKLSFQNPKFQKRQQNLTYKKATPLVLPRRSPDSQVKEATATFYLVLFPMCADQQPQEGHIASFLQVTFPQQRSEKKRDSKGAGSSRGLVFPMPSAASPDPCIVPYAFSTTGKSSLLYVNTAGAETARHFSEVL